MWEIFVACHQTIHIIEYFSVFGTIVKLEAKNCLQLNEMNQVHFEDFKKFVTEDLNNFHYFKITFSSITVPGVELYRGLQVQNKMKFRGTSFYILQYSIPLRYEQFETFEKELLAEFGL